MLPVPFNKYLPQIAKNNPDDGWTALSDKIDEIIADIINDINGIDYIKNPFRIDSNLLYYAGELLAAGILNSDSVTVKRSKYYSAVKNHKNRGLWTEHVKTVIDAITGYSASLLASTGDSDDSIFLANEVNDPPYYWNTWQPEDGVDDALGALWVGAFTEGYIAGNIQIDCHTGVNLPVLSAATIQLLRDALENEVVPAYMVVYLGYINVSGQFTVYANGII